MHARCFQHEECQHIQVCNTPQLMPATSPDIAAISDDDSSVVSSPHVELSESKGEIWPDHQNVVNDYACDYDSVALNFVETDSDLTPPVIASDGDWYNNCNDPFVPF